MNRYNSRNIIVETSYNGSIGLGVRIKPFCDISIKLWDRIIHITNPQYNGNTYYSKSFSNNGTVRRYSVLIKQVVGIDIIQLQYVNSLSPNDFYDFKELKSLILQNGNIATCPTLPPSGLNDNITITGTQIASIPSLSAYPCASVTISSNKLTSFPAINWNAATTTINISSNPTNTGTPHVDMSTKTSNVQRIYLGSTNITTISLPSGAGRQCTLEFYAQSNAGLTAINNLGTFLFPVGSFNFNVSDCALNITFPLGQNPGILTTGNILLKNNGMSLANVNATIDNLYSGRANFGTNAKTLDISGTNARPSGTYQAPTGYIQATTGVTGNDGTPASQLEKIYVLVNQNNDNATTKKYNWTVTYS